MEKVSIYELTGCHQKKKRNNFVSCLFPCFVSVTFVFLRCSAQTDGHGTCCFSLPSQADSMVSLSDSSSYLAEKLEESENKVRCIFSLFCCLILGRALWKHTGLSDSHCCHWRCFRGQYQTPCPSPWTKSPGINAHALITLLQPRRWYSALIFRQWKNGSWPMEPLLLISEIT